MLVNLKKVNNTDKVPPLMLMEINTQGSGKIIWQMVREL